MKPSMNVRDVRRVRLGVASVAALALLVALPGSAQAAAVPVPLGTAASFVVLAGAGVTNTGPTTLHGDLGAFPTTTITGAPVVTGTNHHGDAVTQHAKTALVTAYNVAAGEGPTSPIAGDLTGKTLTRGVYNSASSIGLTGRLTLSGSGPFVFQAGTTLTTGSGSQINLINGARSCNVFWQIGSSATPGTNSRFVGTIMAPAEHHPHYRRKGGRPCAGSQRRSHAGHEHHHKADAVRGYRHHGRHRHRQSGGTGSDRRRSPVVTAARRSVATEPKVCWPAGCFLPGSAAQWSLPHVGVV